MNALSELQDMVYRSLKGSNREEKFGCQAIVNEHDEVEGFNERLLIGASEIPLRHVVEEIHRLGGVSIAAHIDRESFSILGQLGFIPEDLPLDALELSRRTGLAEARKTFPPIADRPILRSSDAHFIEDIGSASTVIAMKQPVMEEFRKAFRGTDGRYIKG